MNAGQKFARVLIPRRGGTLALPVMEVSLLFQTPVAPPTIRDDRRSWLNVAFGKGVKGSRRGIRQGRHPAAPEPFGLQDPGRNAGEDFLPLGAATREPRFLPSDVGLVNFYPSTEALPAGADQDRAEAMKHGPHCLIGAGLQGPLQAQRRDAVFPRCEMPAGGKPDCERGTGPIKNGACHHGGTLSASRTLISAVAKPPSSREPAGWADKAARPSQPFQVVQAIGIGPEPRLEVSKSFGVVGAGTRTLHGAILRQLRLNGQHKGRFT